MRNFLFWLLSKLRDTQLWRLCVIVSLMILASVPSVAEGIITTVAGNGGRGFSGDGGPAVAASLRINEFTGGVAVDRTGNVDVADSLNNRIRKITGAAPAVSSNWRPLNEGLDDLKIAALVSNPLSPQTLFAGASTGVFKSTDGGAHWNKSGLDDTGINVLVVDPANPNTLYAGTDGKGLFKSSDGGTTWSNTGLNMLTITRLLVDPRDSRTLYAAYSGSDPFLSFATLSKSTDGGRSWSRIGLPGEFLVIDPSNPDTLYAYTTYTDILGEGPSEFFKSTNAGVSWGKMPPLDFHIATLVVDPTNSNILYAEEVVPFVRKRYFKSINGGRTWGGLRAGPFIKMFAADPTNPGILYGAEHNSVHRSIDGGTTWSPLGEGLAGFVTTLAAGRGVLYAGTAGRGIFRIVLEPAISTLFVPIVLSSSGANGSFYTSELTLTNRSANDVTLEFTYTAAWGDGSGSTTHTLEAARQKIVPDAIAYLKSLGIPIPDSGNHGGTLWVRFIGLDSSNEGGVLVRTTTAVPEGRAGLAYTGLPVTDLLNAPAYLCGLRQNDSDRSHLAIQHAGSPADGDITLRLTVFSGNPASLFSQTLPDETLSPGTFRQISNILQANGLSLTSGYVRLERVSGTAPYYAYAVINDQANSDGSLVGPTSESGLSKSKRLAFPVIAETNVFSTELVMTNLSTTAKSLYLAPVNSAQESGLSVELQPGEQRIFPNALKPTRQRNPGSGAPNEPYVNPLFVTVEGDDASGIYLGARISRIGGNGRYGLFYAAVPQGGASSNAVWIYGLRRNDETRTNLALFNTGETDTSSDIFTVEIFDGETGNQVNTVQGIVVNATSRMQLDEILTQYGAGIQQGYARVTRTSGVNPFIAYGVINDGAHPGERSGDGAFITSSP